jgi:hypothetical protein
MKDDDDTLCYRSELEAAVKAEREACATLLEANAMACENPVHRSLLQANAAAIRARGQDPMPLFDDWPGGFK